MEIETKLNEYERIPGFVCPSEFWPALGYTESARYVGIWWERGGDEASWADGRDMVVGAEWPAYQALMAHNFAPGDERGWLFGSSEDAAECWLVIDRETKRAWTVPAGEAPQVSQLQWPTIEDVFQSVAFVLPADFDEWLRGIAAAMQAKSPSTADIEQRMVEGHRRYEALAAALEERTAPAVRLTEKTH